MTVRIGSLFSGYGGLDMAVQALLAGDLDLLGGDGAALRAQLDHALAWVCEHEPPSPKTPNPPQAASRLLAHHHPRVPNLGDIAAVDWSAVEPIDVLTGGFPCQDVSAAGKRAGLRPDSRSGLWAHFARAIHVLRPRLVVIENVRGLLSASAACDVEPCPFCLGDGPERPLRALGAVLGDLAVLGYDARWCGLRAADAGAPHARYRVFIAAWPAADPGGVEPERRGVGGVVDGAPGSGEGEGPERERDRDTVGGGGADVADADRTGLEGRRGFAGADAGTAVERGGRATANQAAWGDYGPAIRRWELILGRPAPAPTQTGKRGGQQLSPAFVEWLMGLPAGHVTGVPGLSRNDQLKLLGNGVCPQQAALAGRLLMGDDLARIFTTTDTRRTA